MRVIKESTVFFVENHIWSGRKKISPEDLGIDPTSLPPEELVSLGSKKLIDPKKISKFSSFKTRIDNYLLQHGTSFLSGYLIPDTSLNVVEKKLEEFQKEHEAEKESFLLHATDYFNEWLDKNKEFSHILAGFIPSINELEGKFHLSIKSFKIDMVSCNEELQETITSQILEEVAKEANGLYRSVGNKDRIKRTVLKTVQKIINKIANLSFDDNNLQNLSSQLQLWMDSITSSSGPLVDNDRDALIKMLMMCMGVNQLNQVNSASEEAESPEEAESSEEAEELDKVEVSEETPTQNEAEESDETLKPATSKNYAAVALDWI